MEVIVAVVITTIAVVGLGYTFGLGRGFINRFEVERAALAAAQGQMEWIASTAADDTLVTPLGLTVHMSNFTVGGVIWGTKRWVVQPFDDPADGTKAAGTDPNPIDLRQVTVTVNFMQGSDSDSVRLTRLLPVP